METPDPPNDNPGALKQVVLTPHDIPRILRVEFNTNHHKSKKNNETDPAKRSTFLGFLVVFGRYNLTRSYKWWAPTSSKWKEVTPLCRVK